MRTSQRHLVVFIAVYAVALVLLLPTLSLWLDEVLTLLGARQETFGALLDYVKTVPGGMPLAFFVPRWFMQAFGQSAFAARLPSALASLASCVAVFRLTERARVRTPIVAVIVFAAWPMQLRYAMEARPYAVALALALWTTEIFLLLMEHPSKSRIALYAALTTCAVLTQPYAIFLPAAHLLWSVASHRSARAPLLAMFSAALLLPWYAYFRADWSEFTAGQNLAPGDPRTVLVFLHEFGGSGYAGTALMLLGAGLGLRRASEPKYFWLLCAAVPLLGVPAANSVFHYFFAIRQMIFVLPAFALLFTLGTENTRIGRVVLVAFVAASLYEDVSWFRKPREDWQTAAVAVTAAVRAGACVTFVDHLEKGYVYFDPDLASHECTAASDQVVLAASPYGDPNAYAAAKSGLAARGLTMVSEQTFQGPRVAVFRK